MERPGTAVIASVVVHAGIAGAIAWALMFSEAHPPTPVVNSVAVQVVSEVEVLGAAPLNPSEELITGDVATAPVETTAEPAPPPEPTPPPPTPSPRPPTTPPRTPPPRTPPQPPRPAQPQPQPPRTPRPPAPQPQPGFNPDANAGPLRPGPNRNGRPPTGGGATGDAPRTLGRASLQALAGQIQNNWDIPCDLPGGRDAVIAVRLTLDERGRLVGPARATHSNRGIADGVERAIRASVPFQMPAGYEQQEITMSFRTATMCANR